VRVLILAKPHVGAGYPDVGHQMQFVAHVPGIAMDNRDQGPEKFSPWPKNTAARRLGSLSKS
jgi:hypothetical protein